MTSDSKAALTIAEAAQYISTSTSTLRRQIKQGALSVRYVGRKPIVTRAELDRYIDALPQVTS